MNINETFIFRIVHIDNLDYILQQNKLTTYSNVDADPNYVGIGEGELINLRTNHTITTTYSGIEYCPSCDFLPFYFAPKSVMLYRIKTGWNVAKVEQEKIIYFVYKLSDVIQNANYLFTDGHGYAKITQWFDDIQFINQLNSEDISRKWWNNTEEDGDRERRKQAEFWIENEISLNLAKGIGVYNENALHLAQELCAKHGREIEIKVKPEYYY